MKIYTKTGDTGETGLLGGARVKKDDLRLSAFGEVDEANASIGTALSELPEDSPARPVLTRIQNELFRLGSELATPPDSKAKPPCEPLGENDVASLEKIIDEIEAGLPPLKEFILPGGTEGGAHLHFARCVVRRAERALASRHGKEPVSPAALAYLNRLSDLLFVLARSENARAGSPETPCRQ